VRPTRGVLLRDTSHARAFGEAQTGIKDYLIGGHTLPNQRVNARSEPSAVVLNPTDAQNIDLLKQNNEANNFVGLWWYRIIAHRSYMKGWKITPSHYLNNQLDTVWLAE
jgi:hypothetical protein